MKTSIPRPLLWLMLVVALGVNAIVLAAFFLPNSAPQGLQVSFLDVGQGDSILITGPTGIQVLIDGGKDRSVLRQLPQLMGPLDRTLDMVVATHPDADHIGGLPDVFRVYRVFYFVEPGRVGDTSFYERLDASVVSEAGQKTILARRDMRIHLGDGAYADILFPEGDVEKLREANDASIVMRVVYGETEFLLTGDAPIWVEDRIVSAYGTALESDVLKAGHHGSRTSTGASWLSVVDPEIVVVSAGKDNSYGHPHPEVLERVTASGASVVSTIDEGTVTFVSDGSDVRRK